MPPTHRLQSLATPAADAALRPRPRRRLRYYTQALDLYAQADHPDPTWHRLVSARHRPTPNRDPARQTLLAAARRPPTSMIPTVSPPPPWRTTEACSRLLATSTSTRSDPEMASLDFPRPPPGTVLAPCAELAHGVPRASPGARRRGRRHARSSVTTPPSCESSIGFRTRSPFRHCSNSRWIGRPRFRLAEGRTPSCRSAARSRRHRCLLPDIDDEPLLEIMGPQLDQPI
jgi:hypothetical protein